MRLISREVLPPPYIFPITAFASFEETLNARLPEIKLVTRPIILNSDHSNGCDFITIFKIVENRIQMSPMQPQYPQNARLPEIKLVTRPIILNSDHSNGCDFITIFKIVENRIQMSPMQPQYRLRYSFSNIKNQYVAWPKPQPRNLI